MQNKQLIVAKNFGYVTVLFVIIQSFSLYFSIKIFPANPVLVEMVMSFFTVLVLYPYLRMFAGIEYIALELQDDQFITRAKNFRTASIVAAVFLSLVGVIDGLWQNEILHTINFGITVVSCVYLGMVAIKISRSFRDIANIYGIYAKRASTWHKISGVLMVSVFGSPVGVVASLVADYYMWKIIGVRSKQ